MKRESLEIKAWMVRNSISQKAVAEELMVSPELISMTIHGVKNNKRVLSCLAEKGCPIEWLALPCMDHVLDEVEA